MARIYLAAPYTHADVRIQAQRVKATELVAGKLMLDGHVVFAPTVMGHPIDQALRAEGIKAPYPLWILQSTTWLPFCQVLVILRLAGWEQSKGVAMERGIANELSMPWYYYNEDDLLANLETLDNNISSALGVPANEAKTQF